MGKGNGKANGKAKGRGSRRSNAEGSTGAKDNVVQMRKPSELELKHVIIDDADFDMHMRAFKGATERMKTAKNLYDGVCKAAKKVSDNLLNALKRAQKFEGMDAEDIKRQLEIDGYVLKRQGSPVQLTIHDSLLGDVNKAAYKKGNDDALNSRGANNPYPEGSDLHEQYAVGYRNGMGSNLGLTVEQTEAAMAKDDGPEDEDEDDAGEEGDGEFEGAEGGEKPVPQVFGRITKEPALT